MLKGNKKGDKEIILKGNKKGDKEIMLKSNKKGDKEIMLKKQNTEQNQNKKTTEKKCGEISWNNSKKKT